MSSSSVSTSADGTSVAVTTDDDAPTPPTPPAPPIGGKGVVLHVGGEGLYVQSDRPLDPGSFIAGLLLGGLLYYLIGLRMRGWLARREARGVARAAAIGPQGEDRMAAEVAALARRTATLETIVTDPAHRTAREIDALR